MRFFTTAVSVALAAFAALTSAQASTKANAITAPILGANIEAGDSYDIKWMNTVGSTVTLTLMNGPTNQLKPVKTIIAGLPNSGSYTWVVPDDIPAGADYSIRISYDSNPSNYNYSDRFSVESDVVASSSVSSAATSTTSAASSTSAEASTTSESSSSMETTSAASTSANTTATSASTVSTSTTRRSSTSGTSTAEPTSTGAPPSAGSTTLSSPLAVIMAVLAAALFIH